MYLQCSHSVWRRIFVPEIFTFLCFFFMLFLFALLPEVSFGDDNQPEPFSNPIRYVTVYFRSGKTLDVFHPRIECQTNVGWIPPHYNAIDALPLFKYDKTSKTTETKSIKISEVSQIEYEIIYSSKEPDKTEACYTRITLINGRKLVNKGLHFGALEKNDDTSQEFWGYTFDTPNPRLKGDTSKINSDNGEFSLLLDWAGCGEGTFPCDVSKIVFHYGSR